MKKGIFVTIQVLVSVILLAIFYISPYSDYDNGFTDCLNFFESYPIIWLMLSNLVFTFWAFKLSVIKKHFNSFIKHWLFTAIFCYGLYYVIIHAAVIIIFFNGFE